MIKFTSTLDSREDVLSAQYNEVEIAIKTNKSAGYTRMLATELLPEITAALVMSGYDVFVCRYKDGTSMSVISQSIKREDRYGSATVHSERGGSFEQDYHDQVKAAIEAAKKASNEEEKDQK